MDTDRRRRKEETFAGKGHLGRVGTLGTVLTPLRGMRVNSGEGGGTRMFPMCQDPAPGAELSE